MMTTPVESLASLVIGMVESISSNEIKVLLDVTAPTATALNTGVPSPFPRINGYVLIPNETGALVGMITWMGIEQATFPKRIGLKDFGLVDLPYPLRKMKITPIGTLVMQWCEERNEYRYKLYRGVSAFPSIGDSVVLPTHEQLRLLIEASDEDARLWIGSAPLAAESSVTVDPDKLFGRHLAILGNTGSGKSCSVAGLIRWSLEAATIEKNKNNSAHIGFPNARFIILDPNGEYARAFKDIGCSNCRVLTLSSRESEGLALVAPHWAWTAEEWTGILRTGPGFQGPLLRLALQQLKDWSEVSHDLLSGRVIRFLITWRMWLDWVINSGPNEYGRFPKTKNITKMIDCAMEWLQTNISNEQLPEELGDITEILNLMEEAKNDSLEGGRQIAYNVNKLTAISGKIGEVLGPFSDLIPRIQVSADRPQPFSISNLEITIEMLADRFGNDPGWVRSMLLRLRRFEEDADICSAIDSRGEHTLVEILKRTFGAIVADDQGEAGVIVLDLSFVPKDVLHTVISVLARLIFESLQWYRKIYEGKVLPTVLVLEEAHTFIHRNIDSGEDQLAPSQMCRRTFERIAREGRKFGLGLVISSQRPSEISPTVLAQCNTFLLHRIVNDRDQDLVARLVPDNLGGLLKDLPNLPTGYAILLGWATAMPVLVKMRTLPEAHRPQSKDPPFWNVWTGTEEREVDWERISKEWESS